MFQLICPLAFFKSFISNSGVHTESQTEPFIGAMGVDFSNSVNHDQVQVLSYSKFSKLFLPVVGIKLATFRLFHMEVLFNQTFIH